MKTKIAIFTKAESSAEKDAVTEQLKASGAFDVCEVVSGNDLPTDCHDLVVFGGDGTVLEAVKRVRDDVIVTGINVGNLGFLTQFEKDSPVSNIVDGINCGDYDERMALCVNCGETRAEALNEIVLKSTTSRPVYIDVFVDSKFVDSYHSDGAIVSSPTGSTAYSLSAGGPILAPNVSAIVIIPICAHSLHSRPMVVNSDAKIELRLREDEKAVLCADGENILDIVGAKSITVQKSAHSVKFLKTENDNFYKKLIQKMNRWGSVDPR